MRVYNMKAVLSLVLFLSIYVITTHAQTCPSLTCNRPNPALKVGDTFNSKDYFKDLTVEADWVKQRGGNVSYFNLTTNPALYQVGVAASYVWLEPCGIILPHIHPRGSKAIMAISGKVQVGFITENKAQFITNNLTFGMITVIPRAAIHYVYNFACEPSQQIDIYNNEDPGLLTLGLNMFRFPDGPLSAGLGASYNRVENIRANIPGFALDLDEQCRRNCGIYDDSE